MAVSFIPLLLIVASITVFCDSKTTVELLDYTDTSSVEEAEPFQHKSCISKNDFDCKVTKYSGYHRKMIRWYYCASTKECLPVILPVDQIIVCPGLVDWIIDLPNSKKECEDLCSEPCTVVYEDYKTEQGVCMFDCQVPIPHDVPNPCSPSESRCCPRNYYIPAARTLRKPQYENLSATLAKNVNQSTSANVTQNIKNP